jgi:hypothetical protein
MNLIVVILICAANVTTCDETTAYDHVAMADRYKTPTACMLAGTQLLAGMNPPNGDKLTVRCRPVSIPRE